MSQAGTVHKYKGGVLRTNGGSKRALGASTLNGGHGYPATPLPTASDAKVFTFSCTILIPRSSDAFSSITRCFKSSGPHSCESRFALWRR
jgi:hypothetical protein